jgi:hypothetical protein
LALTFTLNAQESIRGTIPGWSLGKGEVVTGLREPIVVGSVDAAGTFVIPLRPDFMETLKIQVESDDPEKSGGWKSSLLSLRQVFSCYGEDIEVVNGNQPVTRMSSMGVFNLVNMAEKKRLGYLIAASSQDFANGLMEMGGFTFKKGYFLDWIYIDEPGSVSGSCTTESYAVNQEEKYARTTHYDISMKPGWNLVKYEILDLFSDRDGKTYPSEERFVSLDELPADMEYIFFPE